LPRNISAYGPISNFARPLWTRLAIEFANFCDEIGTKLTYATVANSPSARSKQMDLKISSGVGQ
jgi:hypothetical protein